MTGIVVTLVAAALGVALGVGLVKFVIRLLVPTNSGSAPAPLLKKRGAGD